MSEGGRIIPGASPQAARLPGQHPQRPIMRPAEDYGAARCASRNAAAMRCTLDTRHAGDHRDRHGATWAEPRPFAPLAADEENFCEATAVDGRGTLWTCLAATGHDGDHACYGASPTQPGHTWPQEAPPLVSEVGTLAPEEMAALTIARRSAAEGADVTGLLLLRLVAIIERLAGITPSEREA